MRYQVPIAAPYLLSVSVPTLVDANGVRWCNELWAKDLRLHTEYLTNLTVIAPRIFGEPSASDMPIEIEGLHFVDLPAPRNHFEAVRILPATISMVWSAVSRSAIVHTGFGGWPIAEGWVVTPIAKLRRRFLITNVESSFWRVPRTASLIRRARAAVAERLNRGCVSLADLRLFTSKAYAREFLGDKQTRAHVISATWINDDWVLNRDQARTAWETKRGPVRLLFAGRLIEDKGVQILLRAISDLRGKVVITIIGEGPLKDACKASPANVLDPMPYGEPFLELVRGYDAVLIPSLSHEQPRLIFDAFSQAVPVIGSATGGIAEIVEHMTSGVLVAPGRADSLREVILWAAHNRDRLRTMGIAARASCQRFTHLEMHRRRYAILLASLDGYRPVTLQSNARRC